MGKRLALVLFALLLVGAAPALPPPPVTNIQGVVEKATEVLGPGLLSCSGNQIEAGAVVFEVDGKEFTIFLLTTGGVKRFVIVAEGKDALMWDGVLEDDKLVVEEVLPFSEAKVKYPTLCAFVDREA